MNVGIQHRRHHAHRAVDVHAELLVRALKNPPPPPPPPPPPHTTPVPPSHNTNEGDRTTTSLSLVSTSSSPSTTSTPYINPTVTKPLRFSSSSSTRVPTTYLANPTTSVAPSSTSQAASSGATARGVVGGVFATIIGLSIVLCAILFFMRHYRKRRGEDEFDRGSFRRSAVVLPEPPDHADTIERGFNPRPPTMIERRLANTSPVSPRTQQQFNTNQIHEPAMETVDQYQYGPGAGYGNVNAQSLQTSGPGQVVFNLAPVHTPNSSDPLVSFSAYGQSPFSPLASPIAPHDAAREASISRSTNGEVLSRQSSVTIQDNRQSVNKSGDPDPRYIDLSRSSVSPFQAAQYAEIARKLNAEIPLSLPEPYKSDSKSSTDLNRSLDEPSDPVPPYKERQSITIENDPPKTEESPFADTAAVEVSEEQDLESASDHDDYVSPRDRIDSTPPTLPEISLFQRTFSPTPFASAFDSSLSPVEQGKNNIDYAIVTATTPPSVPPKRPYTLYDSNDAYGGI